MSVDSLLRSNVGKDCLLDVEEVISCLRKDIDTQLPVLVKSCQELKETQDGKVLLDTIALDLLPKALPLCIDTIQHQQLGAELADCLCQVCSCKEGLSMSLESITVLSSHPFTRAPYLMLRLLCLASTKACSMRRGSAESLADVGTLIRRYLEAGVTQLQSTQAMHETSSSAARDTQSTRQSQRTARFRDHPPDDGAIFDMHDETAEQDVAPRACNDGSLLGSVSAGGNGGRAGAGQMTGVVGGVRVTDATVALLVCLCDIGAGRGRRLAAQTALLLGEILMQILGLYVDAALWEAGGQLPSIEGVVDAAQAWYDVDMAGWTAVVKNVNVQECVEKCEQEEDRGCIKQRYMYLCVSYLQYLYTSTHQTPLLPGFTTPPQAPPDASCSPALTTPPPPLSSSLIPVITSMSMPRRITFIASSARVLLDTAGIVNHGLPAEMALFTLTCIAPYPLVGGQWEAAGPDPADNAKAKDDVANAMSTLDVSTNNAGGVGTCELDLDANWHNSTLDLPAITQQLPPHYIALLQQLCQLVFFIPQPSIRPVVYTCISTCLSCVPPSVHMCAVLHLIKWSVSDCDAHFGITGLIIKQLRNYCSRLILPAHSIKGESVEEGDVCGPTHPSPTLIRCTWYILVDMLNPHGLLQWRQRGLSTVANALTTVLGTAQLLLATSSPTAAAAAKGGTDVMVRVVISKQVKQKLKAEYLAPLLSLARQEEVEVRRCVELATAAGGGGGGGEGGTSRVSGVQVLNDNLSQLLQLQFACTRALEVLEDSLVAK